MTPTPKDGERMKLPKSAVGMRLARINSKDELILCEAYRLADSAALETVLRRALISGRVEVNGKIADHFADIMDDSQSMVATVSLDAGSYKALKTKWFRSKVDTSFTPTKPKKVKRI